MPEPTVADIFAGCGGSSLGFKQAGFKHLWGIDHEKSACATYEANIGKAICADVGSVDWLSLERPDILIGSPPCQGFSVAGKREKDDPRNVLVWAFVWAVAIFKPKAFLIENVPGVGQGDWAQFPSIVRMALETLGYNVSVFKLNAADYGVPQIRKRVFWAGSLEGFIQIPTPTHSKGGTMGLLPWVTMRQALGIPYDEPSLRVTATEGKGSIYPEKKARASDCLLWVDGYRKTGDYVRTHDVSDAPAPAIDAREGGRPFLWDGYNAKALPDGPSPSIRGSGTQHGILDCPSRPVLAGNDKGTNPLRMKSTRINPVERSIDEPSGALSPNSSGGACGWELMMSTQRSKGKCHTPVSDVEGRLSLTLSGEAPNIEDRPACGGGLTAGNLQAPGHHDSMRGGYRRLSVEECLILQGFPRNYGLVGNQTERYRQVGNAVPPPVAEALAQSILRAINE